MHAIVNKLSLRTPVDRALIEKVEAGLMAEARQ